MQIVRYEYQYMHRIHRQLQKDGSECRVLIKFTDFSFSVLIFAIASLENKLYISTIILQYIFSHNIARSHNSLIIGLELKNRWENNKTRFLYKNCIHSAF